MYKILIAEDVEIIRNMLVNTVDWASVGAEVCGVAENGLEALGLIQETVPDILITDIRMPVMDGFRLILQLQEKHPGVKYIILTAHSDFNYAQNAIKLGVVDYVLKPLDPEELYKAVKKAIGLIEEENRLKKKEELVEDLLKAQFPNLKQQGEAVAAETNVKNKKIVEQAMAYIHNNIEKDISVGDVADIVHLNSKYLNTIFKQVTGDSISRFIVRRKLEKAAEFLRDPSVKVYEVCDKIGYSDPNYFRDIFTKHYGISPSEFKKNIL